MIDVIKILELQKAKVVEWHEALLLTQKEPLWQHIEENSKWNFLLWHEEDIARIKDINPLRIVEAKRNIDTYNQSRNNAIEKIDEWILTYLINKNFGEIEAMHSETPGMIIDRLSIMALKRYHMNEETLREDASADHKEKCQMKVLVLDEQIEDLSKNLTKVLHLLNMGKLKFKVYRQFKMYNDPTLNPQLYKKSSL
ncbi:DUF4254 domain-containing protein [Cognataquiflexum rubidum]|uniref:DUF4254 domain-containing protein n=1 Tax=Cognataquiflexum rubidum TaxID=2922273 RepID=UPI001F1334F8|nr:DUF4254 domain-containing protein [Cognataquiflexum rubidum]MCH6234034.1 DUF4254 domain-containing protein [Cognataquiflexum rubidum]